jgi:hypothetical protein
MRPVLPKESIVLIYLTHITSTKIKIKTIYQDYPGPLRNVGPEHVSFII